MRLESWGKFQNESISKRARAFLSQRPGLNQRPHALQVASLPHELSWFNVDRFKIGLFVCRYIASFQSLMDVQPLWHVDVYQQNVFRRGRNEAKNHILNQNLFSFVSMRIKKNRSRCRPGVSSFWMKFDCCFAIENSRSFKTVICSTNSSSHSLSRDAEHIRLTAFRWRCDKVEMRGTCLEAQKSMQTKDVINSWKLYYDTEDTFTRNRTKVFFDIWRNEEVVL